MNKKNNTLKLSFRLMKGNRKPSILFSAGVFILTAFFCYLTFQIIQMQNASSEKLKELYGNWQVADFEGKADYGLSWQLHRKALAVNDEEQVIGAVGTIPSDFLASNNISLIEGRLPEKDNEIAVTLSMLDALGKTYDVDQSVDLKWKEAEDSQEVHTDSFIITGILPSYDSYWFSGGNLLIDVICSDTCGRFTDDRIQTFLYGMSENQLMQFRDGESEMLVVNEYAWPEQYDSDYGLYGIRAIFTIVCILLIFFLNHLYGKSIRSAVKTLILLGAPRVKIRGMLNVLILICADIPMVFALLTVTFIFSCAAHLYIKAGVYGIVIAALILLHMILYVQLKSSSIKGDTARTVRKSRRFTIASALEIREAVLIGLLFLSASAAITAADWQMLKYNINRPYTAMNIQADQGMSCGIMTKLKEIPYVTETAAYYLDQSFHRVSSEETMKDPVLNAVMKQPGFLMRYEKGVVGMQAAVIPEWETETLWKTYGLNKELQNAFVNGDGILFYLPGYVKQENGMYDNSYTTSEITSLEAGHEVQIDDHQTMILETIRRIQPESLLTNNTLLMPGTLIVSENYYRKQNPQYSGEVTRVNLRLEDNTPESVRRSISAAAVESGGRLSGDTYALVSQIYEQSVFNAQLILLAGALTAAVTILLLIHVENLKNETEKNRIGILRGLGISSSKLRNAYLKRDAGVIAVCALASIAVHCGIVSYMNHGAAKLKIFEMLKCDVIVNVRWNYAWLPIIGTAICIACAVMILKRTAYAAWLSKEPYENLEG